MAMLQDFEIQESWNAEQRRYVAEPLIARWENCREQGYVITLRTPGQTLHIAFFEHRNSDSICAIRWKQSVINSPTIDTAQFNGECYRDKYDVSHQVEYGEITEMANWIRDQLTAFWISQQPKVKGEK